MDLGTELPLLLALGFVVSGPKRMQTMLGHVARSKADLHKSNRGIKSQRAGQIKVRCSKEEMMMRLPVERAIASTVYEEVIAQVALAWLRHQTVPVISIVGARKVSQLQDNLASLDLELSAEQLKPLDGASRLELGFLQSLYEGEMVRSTRYGGMWDRLLL